jgi:4-diphosphocytidyl-2-C-methyl-D-erythritol kinase
MRARAFAKINLGLVVGPERGDGKHEIATVLQRVDLHDVLEVEREKEPGTEVQGFSEDTIVRRSLAVLDARTANARGWKVRLEKRIPVAAGLGGGSSDAAAALRAANELAQNPLSDEALHEIAAEIGSDVPFFLTPGAKLATGDGTEVERLALPDTYWVVLVLPNDQRKESTAAVYRAVDPVRTQIFARRRQALLEALRELETPAQLAELPRNDLATTAAAPVIAELTALGAFRADVSGAGPTVYGLFEAEDEARQAGRTLRRSARTWLARPVEGP